MYTPSASRILERQRSVNRYFVIAIIGDMSFTCNDMVALQHTAVIKRDKQRFFWKAFRSDRERR
jgi:hypothetical protein